MGGLNGTGSSNALPLVSYDKGVPAGYFWYRSTERIEMLLRWKAGETRFGPALGVSGLWWRAVPRDRRQPAGSIRALDVWVVRRRTPFREKTDENTGYTVKCICSLCDTSFFSVAV